MAAFVKTTTALDLVLPTGPTTAPEAFAKGNDQGVADGGCAPGWRNNPRCARHRGRWRRCLHPQQQGATDCRGPDASSNDGLYSGDEGPARDDGVGATCGNRYVGPDRRRRSAKAPPPVTGGSRLLAVRRPFLPAAGPRDRDASAAPSYTGSFYTGSLGGFLGLRTVRQAK